jgi:hypothetical protein
LRLRSPRHQAPFVRVMRSVSKWWGTLIIVRATGRAPLLEPSLHRNRRQQERWSYLRTPGRPSIDLLASALTASKSGTLSRGRRLFRTKCPPSRQLCPHRLTVAITARTPFWRMLPKVMAGPGASRATILSAPVAPERPACPPAARRKPCAVRAYRPSKSERRSRRQAPARQCT